MVLKWGEEGLALELKLEAFLLLGEVGAVLPTLSPSSLVAWQGLRGPAGLWESPFTSPGLICHMRALD